MHLDTGIKNSVLTLNLECAHGDNLTRSAVETLLYRVGGVDRCDPAPRGWKYTRRGIVVGYFTHNKENLKGTWHTCDKLPTPEYLEWWAGTPKRREYIWKALRRVSTRTALREILEACHRAGSRNNLWVTNGYVIPDLPFKPHICG